MNMMLRSPQCQQHANKIRFLNGPMRTHALYWVVSLDIITLPIFYCLRNLKNGQDLVSWVQIERRKNRTVCHNAGTGTPHLLSHELELWLPWYSNRVRIWWWSRIYLEYDSINGVLRIIYWPLKSIKTKSQIWVPSQKWPFVAPQKMLGKNQVFVRGLRKFGRW